MLQQPLGELLRGRRSGLPLLDTDDEVNHTTGEALCAFIAKDGIASGPATVIPRTGRPALPLTKMLLPLLGLLVVGPPLSDACFLNLGTHVLPTVPRGSPSGCQSGCWLLLHTCAPAAEVAV